VCNCDVILVFLDVILVFLDVILVFLCHPRFFDVILSEARDLAVFLDVILSEAKDLARRTTPAIRRNCLGSPRDANKKAQAVWPAPSLLIHQL
jgi:hypothetical protein